MPKTMIAEYATRCGGCDDRINPGTTIETAADGSWQHSSCARRSRRPVSICPKCFMTQPCDCDD